MKAFSVTGACKAATAVSVALSVSLSASSAANAGFPNLFPSAEQVALNDVSAYQKDVNEVIDMLKPTQQVDALGQYSVRQILKDSKEDCDVVANYMERKIKPMQVKMQALAPKLKTGSEESRSRLEILPALMKGHIIELTQAVEKMSSTDELKELEEVQETLAEFLKISSGTYDVQPYTPVRPLTDKELYGPLGCEFWGKKRVPGSNACYVPDPASSSTSTGKQ